HTGAKLRANARKCPGAPPQPLQHRIGVHFEHPRGASDAQSLSQAGDDAHDQLDRGALAVKDGAEGLQKVAATDHTQQLSPWTAVRMPISAEVAPAHPAAIGTVWVGAELGGGVHLATAPPCGHDAGWGS